MRDERHLLRLVEQKQERHKFERPQEITLGLFHSMIEHCAQCLAAQDSGILLHPLSGVFVLRGDIEAATEGRHATRFAGGQKLQRFGTDRFLDVHTHEEFFRFLDPYDPRRRGRARRENESGCGRTFCRKCGQEMIHRDHRHGYESSSALGQIIWRDGPAFLSVMDLDAVSRKGLGRTA
jgi:hypothetical protein